MNGMTKVVYLGPEERLDFRPLNHRPFTLYIGVPEFVPSDVAEGMFKPGGHNIVDYESYMSQFATQAEDLDEDEDDDVWEEDEEWIEEEEEWEEEGEEEVS